MLKYAVKSVLQENRYLPERNFARDIVFVEQFLAVAVLVEREEEVDEEF